MMNLGIFLITSMIIVGSDALSIQEDTLKQGNFTEIGRAHV